jgi:16S rRNA (guanine1516-N2)-methyltransferase
MQPFLTQSQTDELKVSGFALEYDESGGQQRRLVLRDLTNEKLQPLAVDFTSGQLTYRREKSLGKKQPLGRALGLKDTDLNVLDVTAGLGTDSFLMAALGCRVHGIERSPVVFALLSDGYRRLRLEAEDIPELREIADRLSFEEGDACELLPKFNDIDVVYLDPMYPEEGRSKKALPKKGMQMFRRLIGADDDSTLVFEKAKLVARSRVVVKRPTAAPWISENARPNHSFEGKTARYDMYVCCGGQRD